MSPRFLQMVFDAQFPDLPKAEADIIKLKHMNDVTVGRMKVYKMRENDPQYKRLIGHISNVDYVAPEGNEWRHEDSDSENEGDDGGDGGNDGDGGERVLEETVTQPKQS